MKIILATRNKGKSCEIRSILGEVGDYEILSLLDFTDVPEIDEDRLSFAGNAIKKASVIAKLKGIPTLADDSGLEVDALNGAPGIRSARFAGDNASDEENNRKLLELLQDVPKEKRSARFQCAMAFVHPSAENSGQSSIYTDLQPCWIEVTTGSCEGMIIFEPRGNNGFGYDAIFYVPSLGKTFAELPRDEKNKISHRRIALEKMIQLLPAFVAIKNIWHYL